MTRKRKSILLVDDHPMLRSGLAQVINEQKDLLVSGQAGDANEAMRQISLSEPDLALVDISLGDKDGLELTRDIRALHPKVRVLILSMYDESLYAERALRAGARGYVMKKAGGEVVLGAIRQVLDGKVYVSEKLSDLMLEHVSEDHSKRRRSAIESLTDREFDVFRLLGEGCTSQEVGRRLHISRKTVDVYRRNMKQKLKLPQSTTLVQFAVRWMETQHH